MGFSLFKRLKLTSYFLFSPSKFIDIATVDSIQKSFERNRQLRERYPDRNLPEERKLEYRKAMGESTITLRGSIFHACLCVLAALTIAVITALITKRYLGIPIDSNTLLIIRLIGLFSIVWAIFSKVGWEIQTIKGESLPEIINQFWFRLLYTIGAFFLFLAFSMHSLCDK
ncbi:MAG TPA: hypothetical protein EYP79_01765 [Campylobacterales bacterium]|nr:hypothetical protein [Campylobacterales bacterium]